MVGYRTVFSTSVLVSGPLVETPELFCQSFYRLYICYRLYRGRQLRVRSWTCLAGLWTRTRTFGISLSAMFMLILRLFRWDGSANLWWAGVPSHSS